MWSGEPGWGVAGGALGDTVDTLAPGVLRVRLPTSCAAEPCAEQARIGQPSPQPGEEGVIIAPAQMSMRRSRQPPAREGWGRASLQTQCSEASALLAL